MTTRKVRTTITTALLVGLLALTLTAVPSTPTGAEQDQVTKRPDHPLVLKPQDGANIPEPNQSGCPESGPCRTVRVRGAVPEELWPFVVVAPLNATPKMWVQPPVAVVRRDGTFDSIAYCGTDTAGPGEHFSIFIIAHRDRNRFKQGLVLTKIPDECQDDGPDCMVSDPVTVYRTR